VHRYMRAIGFSRPMKRKELDEFCRKIEKSCDLKNTARWNEGDFLEVKKEVGLHIGVCLRGECGEEGEFIQEYYFPYFKGRNLPVYDTVSVEQQTDKESFVGVSENICMGMSMIFYLQNAVDYMNFLIKKNSGIRKSLLHCPDFQSAAAYYYLLKKAKSRSRSM